MKLLKQIKKNNEMFKKICEFKNGLSIKEIIDFEYIKSHLCQFRISELEVLVDMIDIKKIQCDKHRKNYPNVCGICKDVRAYNQAITDITNEIKKIIKELKV